MKIPLGIQDSLNNPNQKNQVQLKRTQYSVINFYGNRKISKKIFISFIFYIYMYKSEKQLELTSIIFI